MQLHFIIVLRNSGTVAPKFVADEPEQLSHAYWWIADSGVVGNGHKTVTQTINDLKQIVTFAIAPHICGEHIETIEHGVNLFSTCVFKLEMERGTG
jgi:hypothetical protein